MSPKRLRSFALLVCAVPLFGRQGTRYDVARDRRITLPMPWKVTSRTPNALEAFLASQATMLVVVEQRRNHDEALRRLEEIAAEEPEGPGTSACQLADQEHVAADRFTAGASGDRVYNVWRNFTGSTSLSGIRIACSTSSPQTTSAHSRTSCCASSRSSTTISPKASSLPRRTPRPSWSTFARTCPRRKVHRVEEILRRLRGSG